MFASSFVETFPAADIARMYVQNASRTGNKDLFLLVQSLDHRQTSEILSLVRRKLGSHLIGDLTLGKCCFLQSKDLKYLQLVSNAGGTGTLLLSGLGSKLHTNTTD